METPNFNNASNPKTLRQNFRSSLNILLSKKGLQQNDLDSFFIEPNNDINAFLTLKEFQECWQRLTKHLEKKIGKRRVEDPENDSSRVTETNTEIIKINRITETNQNLQRQLLEKQEAINQLLLHNSDLTEENEVLKEKIKELNEIKATTTNWEKTAKLCEGCAKSSDEIKALKSELENKTKKIQIYQHCFVQIEEHKEQIAAIEQPHK